MTLPIELIALSEVDSTSTRAAEMLAAGKAAPFAVWAQRQTAGRGRRGNAWQSEGGNLFLTLALPAPGTVGGDWGCLPLKAGVLVAGAIEAETGLRPTLKWPNDILFAGKKLGGLLLEGSLQGQAAGAVLVGIGINLASAPSLDGGYQAVSLADILGRTPTAEAFAAAIVAAFAERWEPLALASVPSDFAAYAIECGHPWRSRSSREFARGDVPQETGAMTVTPLGGGAAEQLSSVDHDYSWAYQSSASDVPLLVADVGNTNTKLARYATHRAEEPEARLVLKGDAGDEAWKAAIRELLSKAPARPWPIHVASVNPAAAARLSQLAQSAGGTVLAVPKRAVRRHGEGYALSDLGIDRLAAVEGWLSLLTAKQRTEGGAAVIANVGTALTIDLVRSSGEHLGGYIAPGPSTALRALHAAAALLPDVPVSGLVEFASGPGKNTVGAMRAGSLQMLIALVERATAWLRSSQHRVSAVEVVLTCGGADALRVGMQAAPRVIPDLVLHGVRVMVAGGYLPD